MKKYNYQVNKIQREKLREKGQFWTPEWVSNAMVSYVSKESNIIFDPATGNGAFLNSLKVLKKNCHFYGIDVDEEVLENPLYSFSNVKVEIKDYLKNPPKNKFPSIVANPPYIRHHRLDVNTKEYLKKLSKNLLGFTLDGRVGYHNYFLIQSLSLLEKNGRLSFILPADTFEGVSAKNLWNWIKRNFFIEAVITFSKEASPFPNVDTNAIIIFIKNSTPRSKLYWIKVNKLSNEDLLKLIQSDFEYECIAYDKMLRDIDEALETGLSRPPNQNNFKYRLKDFAKVMRGIATGANEFFFLTNEQMEKTRIPKKYFKLAIGRTRDVSGDIIAEKDIFSLQQNGRPTNLLSIENGSSIPKELKDYLDYGEQLGLNKRSLINQRTPWYKMEQRQIPPILFAYLGRRNSRFINNKAKVLPLTGFLCVYPFYDDEKFIENLWQALNDPSTLENLKLVGKSYGSDAIKVEPRNLENLPLCDEVVNKYDLDRKYIKHKGQLDLFREKKLKYHLTRASS
jgi:hypothetical protein